MVFQAQKSLTMRPATAAEVMPFVVRASRFGWNGITDLDAIASGAAFILYHGDQPIFGYTLKPVDGQILITSAAGNHAQSLARAGLAMIERQAMQAGFGGVFFYTIRRGLVRESRRCGYQLDAINDHYKNRVYTMRKNLNEHS